MSLAWPFRTLVARLFPVELPAPTGPYRFGRVAYDWEYVTREVPYTRREGVKRVLPVVICTLPPVRQAPSQARTCGTMKHRRLDLGLPPLARLGVHVAFTTLFRRFPELRSAVISEEMRWGSSFLRGLARLPILF